MLLFDIIWVYFSLKGMTLRGARILSSCNDASNKQEQKMNVNIKLEDNTPQTQQPPFYPQVPQMANFTIPTQTVGEFAPSQSTVPNINPCQSRDIDLSKDILQKGCYNSPESSLMTKDLQIADLEDKNKFLQLLLRIYQNNPLYINSLVVCQSQDFMDLVKLLTKCDKVDLILNEDLACGGCGTDSKLIYVSRILITKNNETKEMKYAYNEAYSKLISFNISTKIVC